MPCVCGHTLSGAALLCDSRERPPSNRKPGPELASADASPPPWLHTPFPFLIPLPAWLPFVQEWSLKDAIGAQTVWPVNFNLAKI